MAASCDCSENKLTRENEMIGYVTLGTNNFDEAAKFYDELLGSIGAGRFMEN